MIKSWLITAKAPFCGAETYYCAFSDGNPVEKDIFPYNEIIEELWDNYSWMLHLEDEEYETDEECEKVYEQAYENWKCDCSISAEPMSLEKLQDYIPGGPTYEDDLPEIIYDERVNSDSN